MDLANEGAVSVLDLLMPSDEFGLIAVDSKPHKIVDLEKAEDAASFRGKILSIDSGGGGIFVYEALVESAILLEKSSAPIRHIILFADAADAEEPGKYKEFLDKCVKSNITVSVIGLGSPDDRDAEFCGILGPGAKEDAFLLSIPLIFPGFLFRILLWSQEEALLKNQRP